MTIFPCSSVLAIIILIGSTINKEQLIIKTKNISSKHKNVQLDKIIITNNKIIVN